MKNLHYFLIAGTLSALMILGACEKVTFPGVEVDPSKVSFSEDIQPIFDANCVSCHGGSRAPDLRPDVSHAELTGGGYINTGDPEQSELMLKLYGSHDARASELEKKTILAWITGGAKNN